MIKNDYMNEVAERSGLPKKSIKLALDAMEETVAAHLLDGDEVPVIGGLKLYAVEKDERVARNPKTGEAVVVPAKTVPKAKIGKALKAIFA